MGIIDVYLRKNPNLSHDSLPYSKEIFLDICKYINGKEIIIGEIKGHFFDLSKLCKDKIEDITVSFLHQFDEETFDICNCLINEDDYLQNKGENIYHLDRFFIYPQYRGSGIGKQVLDTFEKNIDLFVENNVRYIGLFPDPITEDPQYDSMKSMNPVERNEKVNHLIDFYTSLGFVKMKTNPNYMYLDLKKINMYKRQIPCYTI